MSWATDIAESMQGLQKPPSDNSKMLIGEVVSVNPLQVKVNGQVISKHLYINSALQLDGDGTVNKISSDFKASLTTSGACTGNVVSSIGTFSVSNVNLKFTDNPLKSDMITFLEEFHKKYVLCNGDRVTLFQNDIAFYITSKVVAV